MRKPAALKSRTRTSRKAKPLKLLGIIVLCVSGIVTASSAQGFQILGQRVDGQNRFWLNFQSESGYYYILQRGTNLGAIVQIRNLALGNNSLGSFVESNAVGTTAQAFYRLQRVPQSAPLDADGDGIDDVWELLHRLPGAALNGGDANEDHNENGQPDLQEYVAQLPPPGASFGLADSRFMETAGTVGIEVRFSRAYTGVLKFQIGGTALEGRDFQRGFDQPPGELLAGQIDVAGTNAIIPVFLLTNDFVDLPRSLVLSIQQPAATNGYRAGFISTHTLTITEGNRGVFGGTISFTNGAFIGPQTVKFALRAHPSGGTAFFDTSHSTLFQRRPFTLPVNFTESGQFAPAGPAAGEFHSEALGKTLGWSLLLANPIFEAESLSARVTLRLMGLSASGSEIVAEGILMANRMEVGL